MCDPVSLGIGLVGGLVASKTLAPTRQSVASPVSSLPDPAAERAAAEADAAQKANLRLAADQRRRREQGSLIAKGAPTFTMGDQPADEASPLGAGGALTSRSTVARRSLMGQGATEAPSFGGSSYKPGKFRDESIGL